MEEQLRLLADDRPQPWRRGEQEVFIRESRRAKRLILQMIPPYTLELVVPQGTRPREVEEFLAGSSRWIERAQGELQHRYRASLQALPDAVELAAVGRRWEVHYGSGTAARPGLKEFPQHLQISTADSAPDSVYGLLRQWLLAQARLYLKPWLASEAKEVGVTPNKIQVRTQRTRWGSCSPLGNISLNASLLFLAPAVVRYLLIHELCHLRHLDHSARYWRCVAGIEPDYRVLDKRLTESWSEVPAWALSR
ncbi:MAG: SprT family zinc-dependent metalloprotease [Gammaproteobacteria bacterium]